MIMKANSKMREILSSTKNDKIPEDLIHVMDGIISNVRLVKNCVIYDTDGITDDDVNLEKILKYTEDLTGYEMGCNEFRFANAENIPFSKVAMYVSLQLRRRFDDRGFVVYVYLDDDVFFLRFHTCRENEGLWLSENLEEYENAILYTKVML